MTAISKSISVSFPISHRPQLHLPLLFQLQQLLECDGLALLNFCQTLLTLLPVLLAGILSLLGFLLLQQSRLDHLERVHFCAVFALVFEVGLLFGVLVFLEGLAERVGLLFDQRQ